MSAADLVAKLAASGTPPELLAAVAEQLFAGQTAQAAIDARRANDRERKTRKSREVTGTHVSGEEIHDKGSLEVSPLASPLPKPSKSPPLNPPKKRDRFPAPLGVSDDQWAAFSKQRKKPWSERSYKLVCDKLVKLSAEGHDPGVLVDLAVENNWETVWPPRQARDPPGKPKYVSKSGHEYRGDEEAVMQEAQRRGDNDTYWRAKGNLSRRGAKSIGELVRGIG